MTRPVRASVFALIALLTLAACDAREAADADAGEVAASKVEHASNIPPLHPNNIVSIASNSEDHTTLVAAIQAADYVTSVAASGPFTVFAPTNAAFEQLPAGTVEGLLEPEKAGELRRLLQYHVTTSSLAAESFRDGQTLAMANGKKTRIAVDEEGLSINGAKVIASIPATNGIIHVIDGVLLPPSE